MLRTKLCKLLCPRSSLVCLSFLARNLTTFHYRCISFPSSPRVQIIESNHIPSQLIVRELFGNSTTNESAITSSESLSTTVLNIEGANIKGSINADKMTIKANSTIWGRVDCPSIIVSNTSGQATFGSVSSKDFIQHGTCYIKKDLIANSAEVDGLLRVDGNITCSTLHLNGVLLCKGNLTADVVKIHMGRGTSMIDEIVCKDSLEIIAKDVMAKKRKFLMKWFHASSNQGWMQLDRIQSGNATIDHTSVLSLTGKSVKVGPGCDVFTLEYDGELSIDETSLVRNLVDLSVERHPLRGQS